MSVTQPADSTECIAACSGCACLHHAHGSHVKEMIRTIVVQRTRRRSHASRSASLTCPGATHPLNAPPKAGTEVR